MIALTLAVVISILVLGAVGSYSAYMLRHHAGWELDQGRSADNGAGVDK